MGERAFLSGIILTWLTEAGRHSLRVGRAVLMGSWIDQRESVRLAHTFTILFSDVDAMCSAASGFSHLGGLYLELEAK